VKQMQPFALPLAPQSRHTSTYIGVMDFFRISKGYGTPGPVVIANRPAIPTAFLWEQAIDADPPIRKSINQWTPTVCRCFDVLVGDQRARNQKTSSLNKARLQRERLVRTSQCSTREFQATGE
jgi:hypothetical protein